MKASGPNSDEQPASTPRRWPTPATIVGYGTFTLGILVGALLAKTHHTPKQNPYLILLVIWAVSGTTHALVRDFSRALVVAAVTSALLYGILVLLMFETNEMFIAGVLFVSFWAVLIAGLMGIPVLLYRRRREAQGPRRGT